MLQCRINESRWRSSNVGGTKASQESQESKQNSEAEACHLEVVFVVVSWRSLSLLGVEEVRSLIVPSWRSLSLLGVEEVRSLIVPSWRSLSLLGVGEIWSVVVPS